jgi:hypothetical protein
MHLEKVLCGKFLPNSDRSGQTLFWYGYQTLEPKKLSDNGIMVRRGREGGGGGEGERGSWIWCTTTPRGSRSGSTRIRIISGWIRISMFSVETELFFLRQRSDYALHPLSPYRFY